MVTTTRAPSRPASSAPRTREIVTLRPEQAVRRGRAERHPPRGLHDRAFEVVPPAAAIDLIGIRLLVQAALAARLPLEMLHRIGDEHLAAIDAGCGDRPVEHAPGGAHERPALQVFLVPRLLADHHQPRPRRAFARNDLRRIAVKRATRARSLRLAQRGQRGDRGKGLGHGGSIIMAGASFRTLSPLPPPFSRGRTKRSSCMNLSAARGHAL